MQIHEAGGARFSMSGQIGGIPVILDECGKRSITNAAEQVVDAVIELCRARNRYAPRAIIYRDSVGRYDAMRIQSEAFAGFIAADASSDSEAFNAIASEIQKPPARLYLPVDMPSK
jgi:hypothetical protein